MRLAVYLFWLLIPLSAAKIYEKCELAAELKTKYQMSLEEVKSWVCIAEFESTFNTGAINPTNYDGSKDFGLFQINNRYWCGDDFGKSECGIACERLLDDDIEDDLNCAQKIIKDTERWTNKPNGLIAWVAYVTKCQTQDLDAYIKECPDVLETPPKEETKKPSEGVTTAPEVEPTKPPRGSGLGFLTGPVREESPEPSSNSSPAVALQTQPLHQSGIQDDQVPTLVKNNLKPLSFANFISPFHNFMNVLEGPQRLFSVFFLPSPTEVNFLESLQGQRPDSTKPSLIQYIQRPPHGSLLSPSPGHVFFPDLKSQTIPLRLPIPGSTSPPVLRLVSFPYVQNQPGRIPPYPGRPISSQPFRMEHLLPGDPRLVLGPLGINNRITSNANLYTFLGPPFRYVDRLPHKPVPDRIPFLTA